MNVDIVTYENPHVTPSRRFVAILTAGNTRTRLDKVHSSSTSMLFYGSTWTEAADKAASWWTAEVEKERQRQEAARRRVEAAKKRPAA